MRKYIASYSISETGKNRTLIGLKDYVVSNTTGEITGKNRTLIGLKVHWTCRDNGNTCVKIEP